MDAQPDQKSEGLGEGNKDISSEKELKLSIFEEYADFAKSLARKQYVKNAIDDIDFQDYFHFAIVGLLESIDRYDSGSEASFKTFAAYRIKGAIINGTEKFSEYREQLAFRYRIRQERLKSIANEAKNYSQLQVFDQMVDLTLGLAIGFMLEEAGRTLENSGTDEDSIYKNHAIARIQKKLLDYVEALPAKEKTVIRYHYYYFVTFEEIAGMLDITKGRVSQLHKSGLLKLQKLMGTRESLDYYY